MEEVAGAQKRGPALLWGGEAAAFAAGPATVEAECQNGFEGAAVGVMVFPGAPRGVDGPLEPLTAVAPVRVVANGEKLRG